MEHLSNYSARDHEVVDYQMYELESTGLQFRGPPASLEAGNYISYLGAAQTFGCFCEHPFPALLQSQLGIPALNLGYGGAGPRFFARQSQLLEIVNRGQAAVVQVMSGRSEDNSVLESGGLERLTRRSDGRIFAADEAWRNLLECGFLWKKSPILQQPLRQLLRRWSRPKLERLVEENRANWIASTRRLLNSIEVPTLLFWFSKREPDYRESYESVADLFGAFPQFINQACIDAVTGDADAYVQCVTQRGSPQPLVSRFSGEPVEVDLAADRSDFRGRVWTQNAYYPSPQMHEDAVESLGPVIRGL